MLRDKNLAPLSRQHQHALALCVRIDRASPVHVESLEPWQAEITQNFEQETSVHFVAEEQVLFPAASRFPELLALVDELRTEHSTLRLDFGCARERRMSATEMRNFAGSLASHIRKEERQLFERIQQLMSEQELADLGARLEVALKDAAQACALPAPTKRSGEDP